MRKFCYQLQDRFKHYKAFLYREFNDIKTNGYFYLLIPIFVVILNIFNNHQSIIKSLAISSDNYIFLMLIYSQSIIALFLSTQIYFLDRISYTLPTLLTFVPLRNIIIGKMIFISLFSTLCSIVYIVFICMLLHFFNTLVFMYFLISLCIISITILFSGLMCYIGKSRTSALVLLIIPFILINLAVFLKSFIDLKLTYIIISVIYFVCFNLITRLFSMKVKQILVNIL